MTRYAAVKHKRTEPEIIASYLPDNYEVAYTRDDPELPGGLETIVVGEDWHGWTLDDYVIPRLGSGLLWARELQPGDPLLDDVVYPSTEKFIAQAQHDFAGWGVETLLDALEQHWGNGVADNQCGDVDEYGYCYRVARWLVWIDSQGFKSVEEYRTPEEAEARINEYVERLAAEVTE